MLDPNRTPFAWPRYLYKQNWGVLSPKLFRSRSSLQNHLAEVYLFDDNLVHQGAVYAKQQSIDAMGYLCRGMG